jgi:hypothetical protein
VEGREGSWRDYRGSTEAILYIIAAGNAWKCKTTHAGCIILHLFARRCKIALGVRVFVEKN